MQKLSVEKKSKFFPSRDGEKIFYRIASVPNPKAKIVLVHGFAEHSGRYEHLINRLNESQYSCLIFDLRGHGRSEGFRGFISSIDDYLSDLEIIMNHSNFLQEDKGYIIAHSMGGLIASLFAEKHPNKLMGLVLSSPAFGMNMKIPAYKAFLGKIMSRFFPKFSLKSTIKAEHLSKDQGVIKQYQRDPLVLKKVTSRLYTEVLKGYQRVFSSNFKLIVPVYIQVSGNDLVVCKNKSKKFFDSIKSKTKKISEYSDMLHEIYNEIDREKPIQDLIAWLDEGVIHKRI